MAEGRRRPGFWFAGRFTPRQVDWMVFAVAALLMVPNVVTAASAAERLTVALVMVPLGTVPLLWRRTRPGVTLALLVAALGVSLAVGAGGLNVAGLLFAVYAAALYGGRGTRVAGAVLAAVAALGAFGATLTSQSAQPVRPGERVGAGQVPTGGSGELGGLETSAVVVGGAFAFGIAWVLGDRARSRRAYLSELEERAARLERERDENARRAATEERIRIARDLHDVVAHNVSVIAVQSGAARVTSGHDPERAAETLGLIERTARETLVEVRSLLGVLRKDDPSAPPALGPQPTLGRIDALVGQARQAGVSIGLRIEGTPRPLLATVDLSAYRIVQEALTNVVKHAPGARVELVIRYGSRALEIVVVDDGPGAPETGSGGHGLIGMRERASLVGGELRAGPAEGGGFRVQARLPIEPLEPTEPDEPSGQPEPTGQPERTGLSLPAGAGEPRPS